MNRKLKLIIWLCLLVFCSATTYAITWQGDVNNYWDEPENWDPNVLPVETDNVNLNNTDPGQGDLPCWIRSWEQQGYVSDPGAEADAVCNQIWMSQNNQDDSALLVDGDLIQTGSFVMGVFTVNLLHYSIQVGPTGNIQANGIFNANNNQQDNNASRLDLVIDGGIVDFPGKLEGFYGAFMNFQINSGHFSHTLQMGTDFLKYTEANPDGIGVYADSGNFAININGPDAEAVLLETNIYDVLIPGGCLQAQNMPVTIENIDRLLVLTANGEPNQLVATLPDGVPVLAAPEDTYDTGLEIYETILDWTWSPSQLYDHSRVIVTPEGGSPIDCGIQTPPFDLYSFSLANPGVITMEWGTQYTWHIIEEDAGNNPVVEGGLWKFAVRALNCTASGDIDGSGDCVVNLADLAVLADEWTHCGWDDFAQPYLCY